jgi:hypothetical protein
MFDIRTTAIAAAAALALGAASSWWLTAEYKDNKWFAKAEAQNVEAAKVLQVATEQAIAKEREHNAISTALENKNAEKQNQHDAVLADNRRLAAKLGGLRDPGRRQSCDSALPTDSGTTEQPAPEAAYGRLSAEASEFLLEFARDADRAAQYASICYEWIQQTK